MMPSRETTLTLKRHAPAMAVAIVLHGAALLALQAGMHKAPSMRTEAQPMLMADLITLPRRIEAPAPVPQARPSPPKVPPKVRAVAAPAPVVEQSVPQMPALAETGIETAPSTAEPQAAAPVAQAAAAPASVIPPRFDAAYLANPKPVYPLLARRKGEEGTVLLHVRVSADGQPAQIEIRTSSGFERLDRAARAAVAHWRFVPARQGDVTVAAWVLVPLVFRMNG